MTITNIIIITTLWVRSLPCIEAPIVESRKDFELVDVKGLADWRSSS